jgi:CRISPR-associated protein (TIGR02584 family)
MTSGEPQKRHILLCVAGLTPQIILETLYALTQERQQPVDEIRVITTIAGRNRLKEVLLDPETGRLAQFCRDYGIDRHRIKFDETTITLLRKPDGTMLEDIRTVEENEFAGDQICDIVRELTKDPDTLIHASAAGGRKTMSIYLTAAMQMFGRAQDALSHVLVSEPFEMNQEFFYIPPSPRILKARDGLEISTAEARIYLADIPFVRLRGARDEWSEVKEQPRSYSEIVERAQLDLDFLESDYEAEINMENACVTVKDRCVRLAPREMFFYAMFAGFRLEGRNRKGAVSLNELRRDDFNRIFRAITRARDNEDDIENCEFDPNFDFLQNALAQIASDDEPERNKFKKAFRETIARIGNRFDEVHLPERYMIVLNKEAGQACYWLPLKPALIKFSKTSPLD